MKNYLAPSALAIGMIVLACLAVIDVVPEKVAQFAPLALLVLFPQVFLRGRCARKRASGEAA